MRLFLDTANFKEIRHGVELGVISGVTTNPTLVAKEGHPDFKAAVREICGLVDGPVSAEVLSLDRQGMMREAREVAGWAPNVVVKLPITADGLAATSVLSREGIRINMTLCFSANQALLAALAGATFVSPFVGRLDDAGHDGMAIVADIAQVFARCHYTTQVLAASIRHPLHCVVAAKAGADVATIPYKVLMQMIQHPLTDIGITRFLEDWRKVYEREEVKTL